MLVRSKALLFCCLFSVLALVQDASAQPSRLENGHLIVPRIDVEGHGALELVFRLEFEDEVLLFLTEVREAELSIANSGAFDPQQLTLELDEILLESGDSYHVMLGLVSQFPYTVFNVIDLAHLGSSDPASGDDSGSASADSGSDADDSGDDNTGSVAVQDDGDDGSTGDGTVSPESSADTVNDGAEGGGDSSAGSESGSSDDADLRSGLDPDTNLNSGERLYSPNGLYSLAMQRDGNLVLRDAASGDALWASGTNGSGANRLRLQGDGNLVMRDADGNSVWRTRTEGTGADRLRLNDDGSLVLYVGDLVIWSVNDSEQEDAAANDDSDSNDSSSSQSGSDETGDSTGADQQIIRVGTTVKWDSNGQDVHIDVPAGTSSGDLLILVLHRTDDDLPLYVDGWTRVAECFKTNNGYDCATEQDCTSWHNEDFCQTFANDGPGHDLAQSIFYRVADGNEPASYTFDMNRDGDGHPGWIILTTLRGAATTDPVRDWAHTGCDGSADSKFPSVSGEAGDMLLLSQSFDDFEPQSKFLAPDGTALFGYVGNSDETGYLFGGLLESSGETGVMRTHGEGASNCKDALVSLTVRPAN